MSRASVRIEALEIKYKDKTIADVLDMTIDQGGGIFLTASRILHVLRLGLAILTWSASNYFFRR